MNENQAPQAPTPAADPARNALTRQEQDARDLYGPDGYDPKPNVFTAALADLATIRDALADRITPAEARTQLDWMHRLSSASDWQPDPDERALIARLNRIADREADR